MKYPWWRIIEFMIVLILIWGALIYIICFA